LREQLEDERTRVDDLQEAYDKLAVKSEELAKERDDWKQKSESPSRRLFKLPPELALASVNGYSSLVDQLVECLMDLKIKEKEIDANRQAIQTFKVHIHHCHA
jgi:chromosome segregation ATPase